MVSGIYLTRKVLSLSKLGSPNDPEVVKDIKLALSKEERNKVKVRTKDALQQINSTIRKEGYYVSKAGNKITSLGTPSNLTDKSREESIRRRREMSYSNTENQKAYALVKVLRDNGSTMGSIAKVLNESGFKTIRGSQYRPMQVKRLIDMYS